MTVPYCVNEPQSDIRAIKSGWSNGKLSSGPNPNQGICLTGLLARHHRRSSPWLRRTIKCPECGGEHVRPCTRVDGYGVREWIANSCETCGHNLSLEEIGRHIVH